MSTLRRAELPESPFDEREILRYAMLPRSADVPEELPLAECLREVRGRVRCRAVWREYPLRETAEGLDLGFAATDSVSLRRCLHGCDVLVLFAATAGVEMDRLIARASLRSPLHGLLMHAIGAERVESACDALCALLAEEHPEAELTRRFSPGYGDLPLSMQRSIFAALDCGRSLGLTLTDSLLMKPAKSVTAIVGLKRRERT